MDDGWTTQELIDEPAVISRPQRAEFVFSPDGSGVTQVSRQFAAYPFHVCRPFHLADDPAGMATLYLQSCSGGIFEHDRLDLSIAADPGAYVHLTSQSAPIVHSMKSGKAAQTVRISAGPGAWIEYLPDPLILFPDSEIDAELTIAAAFDSVVVATDSFLTHDPEGGAGLFRRFGNTIASLGLDGRLLAFDRFVIAGKDVAAAEPNGSADVRAHGSFLVIDQKGQISNLLETLRESLRDRTDVYAGASLLPDRAGAWARVAAKDAHALQACLDAMWMAMRRAAGFNHPSRRK
jgi:urease accessory protein